MLRDVFYYGNKPNVHPREQFAENLADARAKATTHDFWIINEFCDYRTFDWDFDFELLPDEDVWAEEHNNVWPSQHQKDSGTWLCPKEHSDIIIYRCDVDPVMRKNERTSGWVLLDNIDDIKFDFSWHPDPTSPPYIYKWGCKFFPAELKHVLEYHVAGATNEKYMNTIAELLPNNDCWVEHDLVDKTKFDMSWRPDPLDPPYIYVWGNKWIDAQLKPTLEYHAPDAIERKYMPEHIPVLPEWDKWVEVQDVDKDNVDFTWRPDPREPAYIYTWGNKWINAEERPTLQYHCENATEIKYMGDDVPVLPEKDRWKVLRAIDVSSFDFTWRPDPKEPNLIYVFGNELYDAVKMPTITYTMPNSDTVKYVDDVKAKLASDPSCYEHLEDAYLSDYSWVPDPDAPPYIYAWGNQWNKPEDKISIQYVVPGATEYRYMEERATRKPNLANWLIPNDVNTETFDFSWEPNPHSAPYIYQFGTQWQKTHGPKYVVPGASEVSYVDVTFATHLPNKTNWVIPENIDASTFDFSWHPDELSPPFIYQFGTQWQKTGGPKYVVEGATETKYIDAVKATMLPNSTGFNLVGTKDIKQFDYSWHPDETDEPYIYVFGNQWYSAEKEPTVEYAVEGATERKYINDTVAQLNNDMTHWTVPTNVDQTKFDFSWYPDPGSPPYIYEFATAWNERGGPVYTVPGATEHKYIEDIRAGLLPDKTHWDIPTGVDSIKFDFSWVPHPEAPPYIYQFATRLDDIWVDDGPKYLTPGHDGFVVRLENSVLYKGEIEYPKYTIETTLEDLVKQHPTEQFWALNKNINYDNFDFTWKPDKENLFNVTVFGSTESELTHTYFVNATYYLDGHTDFNYVQPETELDSEYLASIFIKPDMFFIDRSNPESAARFEALRAKFGTRIQKTRYLNSWVDTITRCAKRSNTELLWVLNSELDYSDFNFEYYPNPWQMKMVQVFGTQWSHWGTTFMVNRETFAEDTKYIKIIEHLSNLNFVKSVKATAANCVYDVVVIDHGNKETASIRNQIESKINGNNITVANYDTSYLNTIRNVLATLPMKKEHYIWICSSVCDYSNFDFTYICDPFTRENLHVFPSGKQKFGDTFLIDVNKTRELINDIVELGEYDQVNYNQTMRVNRLEAPKLITEHDTLVDAIKNSILDIDFPYATLMTVDNTDLEEVEYEPLNLWSNDTKNIIITTTGATRVVIPTQAKDYIDYELYDYPYIKRAPKLVKSNPLDIVFLSNGETGAEENYEHLLKVTENLPNRVVRVDGVNGRAAAYHAAAEASNTPWFFTVFAKLEVNAKFDWSWQPDRMQIPKHYIFHAKNPVNGLIYGHQAMIAYNKKLTLGNEGKGLDFTLDNHHEVVPLISGTARYNTDSFSAWRTAFRESIKLKMGNDDDSRERLEAWLTKGEGEFAEYSIKGAQDAMTYYDEVNGDFDKLKLSYEWAWLREKFDQN